ncbi:hypothetical protein Poli38472_009808 [Pythium oligandrum]|uniref:Endonuclease/exonuclease/phosphatase domain-containing protein n=1 Tax=Pythium oligandrum TaxID=41045 RepID=A0A8K1CGI5_PYTOL|nr:hypothetical protein Poli38472_009808 [Pythium oligandrum]|eukprot:TMW62315.1 hypothetical protein Poli38472_009808 [Pythium oligandrum]
MSMMTMRLTLVALVLCGLAFVHAWPRTQKELDQLPRWDYWQPVAGRPQFTGRFLASRPGMIHLKKQTFDVANLFDLDETVNNKLLYGSILLKPTVVTTAPLENPAVKAAFEFAIKAMKISSHGANLSPTPTLVKAVILPLYVTGDNGETEMVVLHEFQSTRRETEFFRSHVTLGTNFYLTIEDLSFQLRHQVGVGLDREHVHNLFQHTFAPLSPSATQTCDTSDCHAASPPRILSFNVWNTNPSGDVYGQSRRWDQYNKRIDHLMSFVKESRADIVGFQEVRYDGVLANKGQHSQVEHLAKRLPGFQFVYQAAMSYINDRSPYERIEEGPAIFSKYPIVETDYLLLSRDPNDPNDSHQRLCLHAVVDHPQWGWIDVYATHLSLSERSREQTMLEIWNYMQHGKGVTQVLLGDLNAEPDSRGIQFLRGDARLDGQTTDLKDAWLEKHMEAAPRSPDAHDRAHKFTFPSDNPIKRIDFILYRGKGAIKECEILAQAPTEDTKDFPTDVGMLNSQSPIYASDHRAVVAEFTA